MSLISTQEEIAKLSLGGKQKAFTLMKARLIIFAYEKGYELVSGDAHRNPRVFGKWGRKLGYGSAHSVHKLCLAQDFSLFVNGKWIQTSEHQAWNEMHEFWESIGGSKMVPNDAGHFSIEHNGYR